MLRHSGVCSCGRIDLRLRCCQLRSHLVREHGVMTQSMGCSSRSDAVLVRSRSYEVCVVCARVFQISRAVGEGGESVVGRGRRHDEAKEQHDVHQTASRTSYVGNPLCHSDVPPSEASVQSGASFASSAVGRCSCTLGTNVLPSIASISAET